MREAEDTLKESLVEYFAGTRVPTLLGDLDALSFWPFLAQSALGVKSRLLAAACRFTWTFRIGNNYVLRSASRARLGQQTH